MPTPYGMKGSVAIAFQNSFGVQNVTSFHFIPMLSEDIGREIPPLVNENMRGIFDEGDDHRGPNLIAGDIEAEVQPLSVGALISTVLGKPTSVDSGNFFTHTWEPRTADFDIFAANVPFTYYKDLNDGGSAQIFRDMVGSVLELSIANGEFLKAKVSMTGGNFAQIAAIAASYPVGGKYPWSVSSVQIGGVANAQVMDMTVTVDEAIEPMYTLNGSLFPARTKRTGFRTVAVEGTLKFDDQVEFQQFLTEGEQSMILTMVGATVSSGFTEDFILTLPLLRYTEFKPPLAGPGQVEVGFSAKGKYSVTSATALHLTLVNTLTGY